MYQKFNSRVNHGMAFGLCSTLDLQAGCHATTLISQRNIIVRYQQLKSLDFSTPTVI